MKTAISNKRCVYRAEKFAVTEECESRRIRAEIRQVLVNYWDPIGIKDEPHAQDEYDFYLGGIYELLVRGASEEELCSHLWQIVETSIGLHPQAGATKEAVKQLRSIKLT